MFEADHALKLLESMKEANEKMLKIALDTGKLMQQVNPTGAPAPLTQESVMLLNTQLQLMALNEATMTIGKALVDVLTDRATEQDLGLS